MYANSVNKPSTSNDSEYLDWISSDINQACKMIYQANKERGCWDKPRETGTLLMLIVSEISKAMEGARKELQDTHLPTRKMFEVELADAIIRIFDLAGSQNLDLGGAIAEKLAYNAQRQDHKREVRALSNGKAF